jgi:chitosanase
VKRAGALLLAAAPRPRGDGVPLQPTGQDDARPDSPTLDSPALDSPAKKELAQAAQDAERDRVYFGPAVRRARLDGLDGLGALGQFVYYDAMVCHGPGRDGFEGLRARAMREADTPAEVGSEKAYLTVFLDVRRAAMKAKRPGIDTTRIDTAQRKFLADGNLGLRTALVWKVYGETYKVP